MEESSYHTANGVVNGSTGKSNAAPKSTVSGVYLMASEIKERKMLNVEVDVHPDGLIRIKQEDGRGHADVVLIHPSQTSFLCDWLLEVGAEMSTNHE